MNMDTLIDKCLNDPSNLATEIELREQLQVAARAFTDADIDGSGALNFDEITRLCSEMGLPLDGDEEEYLLKMDKNDSGQLDLDEWLEWWISRVSHMPNPLKQQEAIAMNTFMKLDKDGNGTLDIKELENLVLALGASFTEEELRDAMAELDVDGNEILDCNEFVQWWTNRVISTHQSVNLVSIKLKRLAKKAAQMFSTDIFTAVWTHDTDLVREFLRSDSRLSLSSDDSEYGEGWTPLHYACYKGFDDILDEIIEVLPSNGVNRKNAKGFSPLFYACQQGHINLVPHLLAKGADPSIAGIDEEQDVELCAADFVVDYPSLKPLIADHPKCRPPSAIEPGTIRMTFSKLGDFTIELPRSQALGHLPIRKWRVRLVHSSSKAEVLWIIHANANKSTHDLLFGSKIYSKEFQNSLAASDSALLTVAVQAENALGDCTSWTSLVDLNASILQKRIQSNIQEEIDRKKAIAFAKEKEKEKLLAEQTKKVSRSRPLSSSGSRNGPLSEGVSSNPSSKDSVSSSKRVQLERK